MRITVFRMGRLRRAVVVGTALIAAGLATGSPVTTDAAVLGNCANGSMTCFGTVLSAGIDGPNQRVVARCTAADTAADVTAVECWLRVKGSTSTTPDPATDTGPHWTRGTVSTVGIDTVLAANTYEVCIEGGFQVNGATAPPNGPACGTTVL